LAHLKKSPFLLAESVPTPSWLTLGSLGSNLQKRGYWLKCAKMMLKMCQGSLGSLLPSKNILNLLLICCCTYYKLMLQYVRHG
jgi:hypothetical protein